MQMQVDVGYPFDRGPRLWERLSGPRHLRRKRGRGAGRVCLRTAAPPGEQAHQAGSTYAHNYPGGDQENVEDLGLWGSITRFARLDRHGLAVLRAEIIPK